MKRVLLSVLTAGLLFGHSVVCCAGAPDSEPVDGALLAAQHIPSIGQLMAARRIRDQAGEHVLVLNRQAGPSPASPKSGRVEHIELHAAYYSRQHSGWIQDLTVRDLVDCPGLDLAADFFLSSITITDINRDGKAEVTIPYKLFCGGGIDPYTVKVILREGPLKLAIRGESEVRLTGQPAFGGGHDYDKALLTPAYSAYKTHMDQIWTTVSADIRR